MCSTNGNDAITWRIRIYIYIYIYYYSLSKFSTRFRCYKIVFHHKIPSRLFSTRQTYFPRKLPSSRFDEFRPRLVVRYPFNGASRRLSEIFVVVFFFSFFFPPFLLNDSPTRFGPNSSEFANYSFTRRPVPVTTASVGPSVPPNDDCA